LRNRIVWPFQLLVIGMLLNTLALAQMPANMLDAVGRSDLRAKLFLSYVPVYLIMLWFLVTRYGIEGAALAWLLRSVLKLVLFLSTASRCIEVSLLQVLKEGVGRVLAMYGFLVSALLVRLAAVDGKLLKVQPLW
jgi:O-antigen/teichoic acid export membrane protein